MGNKTRLFGLMSGGETYLSKKKKKKTERCWTLFDWRAPRTQRETGTDKGKVENEGYLLPSVCKEQPVMIGNHRPTIVIITKVKYGHCRSIREGFGPRRSKKKKNRTVRHTLNLATNDSMASWPSRLSILCLFQTISCISENYLSQSMAWQKKIHRVWTRCTRMGLKVLGMRHHQSVLFFVFFGRVVRIPANRNVERMSLVVWVLRE